MTQRATARLEKTSKLLRQLSKTTRHDASAPQLSLQELGGLVIGAGAEAGFVVHVEFPVQRKGRRGTVDCVWLARREDTGALSPVVAWEFDGRDVGLGHVRGDERRIGNIKKLQASKAPLKCQAFYSYRNGALGGMKAKTISALKKARIAILSDQQLLSGCIAGVVDCAIRKAKNDCLKLL